MKNKVIKIVNIKKNLLANLFYVFNNIIIYLLVGNLITNKKYNFYYY